MLPFVREAVIDCEGGVLTLRSIDGGDTAEGFWYKATLALPTAEATVKVFDFNDGLAGFARGLADAWAGFNGRREWCSLDGEFRITCTHNGLGAVECSVTLCEPSPPEWLLRASLTLGAGAHLDRVANDLLEFFGDRT